MDITEVLTNNKGQLVELEYMNYNSCYVRINVVIGDLSDQHILVYRPSVNRLVPISLPFNSIDVVRTINEDNELIELFNRKETSLKK